VIIFFIGTRNECDDNGGVDEHADDDGDKGW